MKTPYAKHLLKSAAFDAGRSVVLVRPKRWIEAAEQQVDPSFEFSPGGDFEETNPATDFFARTETTEATEYREPAAPAIDPVVTYEEYRARFEEELFARERQAVEEGFEKGQREGREQGSAEYAAQIEALAAVLASARASLDQAMEGMSELGAEVVYEAVLKIVGEAMPQKETVIAAVREVIRRAKERTRLVVRVSPKDWDVIKDERERLLEGLSADSVEIAADDRIALGGCILETPAGNLDGRLEVQLDRLRGALLNAAPKAAEAEPEA